MGKVIQVDFEDDRENNDDEVTLQLIFTWTKSGSAYRQYLINQLDLYAFCNNKIEHEPLIFINKFNSYIFKQTIGVNRWLINVELSIKY
ncbi:unnamed protein product [Rotaria magnacalcarata]